MDESDGRNWIGSKAKEDISNAWDSEASERVGVVRSLDHELDKGVALLCLVMLGFGGVRISGAVAARFFLVVK